MPLHPSVNLPERILMMGAFGTGKTSGWLQIAQWAQRTKSVSRFYVLDTDSGKAVQRMLLSPSSRFAGLENVEVVECYGWEDYTKGLDGFLGKATERDWIVCDFVGTAWEAVQTFYVDQIYGSDMGQFFLDARANMRGGNPLDGWKDWSVVNRLFRGFADNLFLSNPAHVYVTAQAQTLRETDAKEVKAVFGAHGVRPVGQKNLAYQVHTVLLSQQATPDKWVLNTIKDRERPALVGAEYNDFVRDYLMPVAGWSLT
jgi:hypothetical protein